MAYTREDMEKAVAQAKLYTHEDMQMAINAATAQGVRTRMAAAMSGGYDFADTLHNIYLDFGYPWQVEFFNFWNMYRRFGIAGRVVELYPDQTWLDDPVIEANDRFMRELEILVEERGLWRRLKGLDTRQRVGRYAGLFMRVRDGKKPEEPLDGKLNGPAALVDMMPLYESQLDVVETQDNVMADDYGKPTMYQFKGGTTGSRNPEARNTFNIHPSRVVIASEGSDNGNIYGVSALEKPYNSLMDMRKIIGGGAEGFYKNAAQSIVFDLKDGASAKSNKAILDAFNENYDEFAQNRARRAMWTPGMEAKTLDSTLIQPKEFFNVALYDVSAASKIPASLLIGNQTGRLAGDQDTKGFLAEVQARRNDFGTDVVRAALDWLATHGILPSESYEIEWPDALAPSATEKLANAKTMADVNETAFKSGDNTPFSSEEIREAAGFDPEDLPEPTDENDRTVDGDPAE